MVSFSHFLFALTLVLPSSMFFHQYVKKKMGKNYLTLEILKNNIFILKQIIQKNPGSFMLTKPGT